MAVPQGLTDALNAALAAKDAADAAVVNKQNTAAAAAAAKAADDAAAQDLTNKAEALDQARQKLEAVEDAYLAPGATLPDPTPPAPPAQ